MLNKTSTTWIGILLLAFALRSQPAEALWGWCVQKKSDAWLIKKSKKAKKSTDQILLIEEMGVRRSREFLTPLITYTSSELVTVRSAAFVALSGYGPSLLNGLDGPRDQAYLKGLEDSNAMVRKISREALLERLQSEFEIAYIRNAMVRKLSVASDFRLQLELIQILQWTSGEDIDQELMIIAAKNSNAQLRKSAIQALGQRQSSAARETLHSIRSRDLEPEVRAAAEEALIRLGGKVLDIVVAVMPFESTDAEIISQSEGVQDYLSGRISGAQIATVVERGQVDKVMAELIYQDQNIDDDKAISIGRSLRASQVVTGSIQRNGANVTITIKRIDVESQEILSSAEASGAIVDFDAIQREASSRFLERF